MTGLLKHALLKAMRETPLWPATHPELERLRRLEPHTRRQAGMTYLTRTWSTVTLRLSLRT